MKLLLDTHIWIWSVLEQHQLRPRVSRALQDQENQLWLSPISIWELLIFVEKRRVSLHVEFEEWVSRALAQAPLREAPLTRDVALETRRVQLSHSDPADRFLVATARVFDLTLVTADRRLFGASGVSVLPNR